MINVTCAIIQKEEKVLITQRSEKMRHPLLWEFPGGKINANESEEDCIRREIKEELNIVIQITKKISPQTYQYPDNTIKLIPFIAEYISGNLELREHKDYRWVNKQELQNYEWVPADIAVYREYLAK